MYIAVRARKGRDKGGDEGFVYDDGYRKVCRYEYT